MLDIVHHIALVAEADSLVPALDGMADNSEEERVVVDTVRSPAWAVGTAGCNSLPLHLAGPSWRSGWVARDSGQLRQLRCCRKGVGSYASYKIQRFKGKLEKEKQT